ncbi:amino acid adenylation domain-containing protein [Streptomyces sp. NPDC004546]|uniref:amino acid adenylation domain-containing protein n=1 Tax=Streptomyces sp. NPDC004546 TaxID=3154282 RepID=UPI0033B86298
MTTIVEEFESRAARTPDADAVVADADRLTYSDLMRLSDRLASALHEGGVVRGDRVIVMMPRSALVPVALLAVLKVGAVYVPLDTREPMARIAYLADDTGAKAAICDVASRGLVEELGLTAFHPTDAGTAAKAHWSIEAHADDLAYLMYTSGSTGRPKGVLIEHRNVVNLVTRPTYCDFNESDRVLQLAPIAFDAATFEIWGPLLNGGCLVMAPPEQVLPDHMGDLLRRFAVSKLWLTAALLHSQVDVDVDALRGVGTVLAGGDVLSVHHVQKLRAAAPESVLVNGYGPTETTTFACCHRIGPDETFTDSIPIGRPIQNVRVRVVGEDGRDAALGAPGELWIGGRGVGRGYWRREDLTAEKFVTDSQGLVYRSGDLVRHRPDGLLEYLGRIDGQMKLHGHRIEPGEVEHAIMQHPHVRQAAVARRTNHLGDDKLVAWIVLDRPGGIDRKSVRRQLTASLPNYMVPAAFVVIDQLPLTPNGKVDRRALTVPDWRERAIYV